VSVFSATRGRVPHVLDLRPGGDLFKNFYNYLDLTPLGRQEAQLEHPGTGGAPRQVGDENASTAGANWWNGTDKYAN